MNSLYNLARVTTETTGTGTLTLGAAVASFLTFAQSGVSNADVVTYVIEDADGGREIGQGTYTASGTTLSRDVVYRSTGAGNTAKISLSGSAQVYLSAAAEDFANVAELNVAQTWTASQTFTGVWDAEYSNASTAINNIGARYRVKNTDGTASNWLRMLQGLDSANEGVGGVYIQVLDHTTHEADIVFLAHTAGAGNQSEKFRIKGSGLVTVGGNTSGFPAFKRSGTTIQVRLADDSAYGSIDALSVLDAGAAPTGTAGSGYVRATSPTINTPAINDATIAGTTVLPATGRITSGGLLYLGHSAAVVFGATSPQGIQVVVGTGTGLAGGAARNAYGTFSANANPVVVAFGKSRGSLTVPGAVVALDGLGQFAFYGDDGSTAGAFPVLSAVIAADVATGAVVSTGVVPSQIDFETTSLAGVRAVKWRIGSEGIFGTGSSSGHVGIRRSGTTLEARLADNSAYCNFSAAVINSQTKGSKLLDQIFDLHVVSTALLTKTSNITLEAVAGLTFNLEAGKTYILDGWLSVTSGASGGLKVALVASGGLTITAGNYGAVAMNGITNITNTTVNALGANIVAVNSILTDIEIGGTITVGVAGTLTLQAAQNTSNGTASTVKIGSFLTASRVN